MKAAVLRKYGVPQVLRIEDVEQPIPSDSEVLVKIHASSVIAGDCEMRRMDFPLMLKIPLRIFMGIFRPRAKILGQECAGEIVMVGSTVEHYAVGDRVFLTSGFKMSTNAEFITINPDSSSMVMTTMPSNLSYTEAATIPVGGLNALRAVTKMKLQSGQHLLINGAGGSIGTMTIQLAKLHDVVITAVDHQSKLELLTSLGADHVIDYQHEDFTEKSQTYDVIFDIVGSTDFSRSLELLKDHGSLILGNPTGTQLLFAKRRGRKRGKSVITNTSDYTTEDLINLRNLIEEHKLRPVVDKIMTLDEISAAHEYVEGWQKKGSLAIQIIP